MAKCPRGEGTSRMVEQRGPDHILMFYPAHILIYLALSGLSYVWAYLLLVL